MNLNAHKFLSILLIYFFIIYPSNPVFANSISDFNNQNFGTLQIISNPEEAIIYVEGEYIGTTPKSIELNPGKYHIRLVLAESPLYYEEIIEILEDEVIEISVDFCSLAYNRAKEENDIESLKKFIDEFPYCAEVNEAERLICSLVFEEAEREGTIDSYEKYINDFPGCYDYIVEAEKRVNAMKKTIGEELLGEAEKERRRISWWKYEASKRKAAYVRNAGITVILASVILAGLASSEELSEYEDDLIKTARICLGIGAGITLAGLIWSWTIPKPSNYSKIIFNIEISPFSKDSNFCKLQSKNLRICFAYKICL